MEVARRKLVTAMFQWGKGVINMVGNGCSTYDGFPSILRITVMNRRPSPLICERKWSEKSKMAPLGVVELFPHQIFGGAEPETVPQRCRLSQRDR